jgi:hypothetical protein
MILEYLPYRAVEHILPTLLSVSRMLLSHPTTLQHAQPHVMTHLLSAPAGGGKRKGEPEDVQAQPVHQRVLRRPGPGPEAFHQWVQGQVCQPEHVSVQACMGLPEKCI